MPPGHHEKRTGRAYHCNVLDEHGFVIGLSGSTGDRIDHERIGVAQPRVGIVSLCGEA